MWIYRRVVYISWKHKHVLWVLYKSLNSWGWKKSDEEIKQRQVKCLVHIKRHNALLKKTAHVGGKSQRQVSKRQTVVQVERCQEADNGTSGKMSRGGRAAVCQQYSQGTTRVLEIHCSHLSLCRWYLIFIEMCIMNYFIKRNEQRNSTWS